MIFHVALAQIVDQKCQMQSALLLKAPIQVTEQSPVVKESRRLVDGPQAMLVDGEPVVFVELKQAAGVGELRHDFLKHADLVQLAEQLAEPLRLREQRKKAGRALL